MFGNFFSLNWMSDIVNSTLSGAEFFFFCSLLSISELCSETQCSYLETYWKQCDSFEACFLSFVRQDHSSFSSRANLDF